MWQLNYGRINPLVLAHSSYLAGVYHVTKHNLCTKWGSKWLKIRYIMSKTITQILEATTDNIHLKVNSFLQVKPISNHKCETSRVQGLTTWVILTTYLRCVFPQIGTLISIAVYLKKWPQVCRPHIPASQDNLSLKYSLLPHLMLPMTGTQEF